MTMSEGDWYAFPLEPIGDHEGVLEDRQTGMTYRQWLIGQAVASTPPQYGSYDDIAMRALTIADTVFDQMDREKQSP